MQVRHFISGRIRFKICSIKDNLRAWLDLENQISDIAGVIRVRINPKCASLIVRFDSNILTRVN